MKLPLSIRYSITFLLLLLVMMEFHELVHITTGRIVCGCWGSRDFNVWSLCDSCKEQHPNWWLATLSGPVFSFSIMWVGMFFLRSRIVQMKRLGFAFIFANIPFGRITTVMMGGGDEMVVTRHFLSGSWSRNEMIVLCSAIVLLLGVPPVIMAWRSLTNKKAWIYITGFLLLPLLFLLIYLLTGLNSLLHYCVLSSNWIMGTPVLITAHTILVLTLLILFHRKLTDQP